MTYEMRAASFGEYLKFCEHEGIVPVPSEAFTWQFWIDFCNAQRIAHSAIAEMN